MEKASRPLSGIKWLRTLVTYLLAEVTELSQLTDLNATELYEDAYKWLVQIWDILEVIFQKRVRRFHQVSKRETTRPQAEWFYCFRAFRNLIKPKARVFEITSPTKKISLNYHLNKFPQFYYYI